MNGCKRTAKDFFLRQLNRKNSTFPVCLISETTDRVISSCGIKSIADAELLIIIYKNIKISSKYVSKKNI